MLLFDIIIGSLDFMAKILPKQFEDPAELAKIGKYYAVEDMLTTDPSEKASSIIMMSSASCHCFLGNIDDVHGCADRDIQVFLRTANCIRLFECSVNL